MKALKRSHTSPSSASNHSSSSSPASSVSASASASISSSPPSNSSSALSNSSWIHLRSVLFVVASTSPASSSSSSSSDRSRVKSPWSRRKRKHALSPQQWTNMFAPNGKFHDAGVKLLKIVRSGGVDPSIRGEVWQFLLGVYDVESTQEEREIVRNQKRKEYENLRRQCRRLLKSRKNIQLTGFSEGHMDNVDSYSSDDAVSARESLSSESRNSDCVDSCEHSSELLDGEASSRQVSNADSSVVNTDSSDSDSGEESGTIPPLSPLPEEKKEDNADISKPCTAEDFATWQRIIRLDAVRANFDWISYIPSESAISEGRAYRSAEAVGLKDYDQLEPCIIFHAARLVAILEAYALFDPEIGYCQGMSDLLSPIIAFVENDHEAFWCFVGFMKKARHNFRLDEMGIRRQLSIVSRIIKRKDSHLYRHLEKLQAEDCFFVYRMVVVLFRRELTFDQTVCLWEVMWADQAAIRAGIGKSAWSRIRQRAPPTEDLVLYAIAASVLQRRKLIIERYSSMDEIIRECNNMAGQLDIWKLLDDAHNLVVTLHDKVETPLI